MLGLYSAFTLGNLNVEPNDVPCDAKLILRQAVATG